MPKVRAFSTNDYNKKKIKPKWVDQTNLTLLGSENDPYLLLIFIVWKWSGSTQTAETNKG